MDTNLIRFLNDMVGKDASNIIQTYYWRGKFLISPLICSAQSCKYEKHKTVHYINYHYGGEYWTFRYKQKYGWRGRSRYLDIKTITDNKRLDDQYLF